MRTAAREQSEWQLRAACRGPHSSVFYPPEYVEKRHEKRQRELRAKDICATCSVQPQCLQYALDIGEQHGIWGGLNEIERRKLLLRIS
ncbi:MAG: WhiB family transcriptional regulator [Acidimicrobiaceae bacterium]|nr:WhiB family transcriptional regulator [Acidimicrobiaceae bacterium]MCY4176254.1 WhiB family transcriptional regulator [Acidimicrobiaceae bacterium]MCY4280232.1 WhiB family transcriptional regulator [Acidimicrobiaceae bacterium]MCY4293586.1 WhiB family transcriptional regulator [Acidimicrobiaceae bacterium]